MRKSRKNIFLASLFLLVFFLTSVNVLAIVDNDPQIGGIEEILFGKTFINLKLAERINRIENNIFGQTYKDDSLDKRTRRIKNFVLGKTFPLQDDNNENKLEVKESASDLYNPGYENVQTQEITESGFLDLLIQNINNERSFKGLLPVEKDVIAVKVAEEEGSSLIQKGYLSYFNLISSSISFNISGFFIKSLMPFLCTKLC